ncbi:GGDEF domain-containing protein [Kangiella sediminilitoris]|uniref:GGDEF domain-containing protein n=1 Tax=Kangiella sediminilitoris TaxID=1144748 RepID=A0A1B3BD54_9GAMM|nr:GGDEF domain-containing protein [Kangiella sediminilitoris]AOE50720.1 hypothetical protein KS2013_2013 [Kangiella sediminilitoris]
MKLLNDINQIRGWERVLERSINKILIVLAVCAIPAALASVSRVTISGFQPSMVLHIAVSASLVFFALRRRHFSIKLKLNYLLLLSLLISTFGVYNWGLMGNGFIWSVLGIIFITLYYGSKFGAISAVLFCLYCTIIGVLYITGKLQLAVEPGSYVTSIAGWATAIIGALLPLSLTVLVVGTLYNSARSMLQKLEKQQIEITILAEQDSLTGLYNTRVFQQLIEQAMERSKRHDSWVYLINIDLNSFKQVNDNYGHHAGDQILKHVANQLLSITRGGDTLCRVGGDEFLILLEHPKRYSSLEIIHLIKRLKQAVSFPYEYDGTTLKVSCSAGYAEYNALHTPYLVTKDDILKEADRKMFEDKKSARTQQAS